jgi:TonB family protein
VRSFLGAVLTAIFLLLQNSGVAAQSSTQEALMGEWKQKVSRHLLQRFARSKKQLQQPYNALGPRTVAGTYVIVWFRLERSGRLIESAVDHGSGYPAVDAAALQVVRQASPFPAAPIQLPYGRADFKLPVTFNAGPFRVRM